MRSSVSTRAAFAALGSLPRSQSYRVGRVTRRIPASWALLSDSAAWSSCICSMTGSATISRKLAATFVGDAGATNLQSTMDELEPTCGRNEPSAEPSNTTPVLPEHARHSTARHASSEPCA